MYGLRGLIFLSLLATTPTIFYFFVIGGYVPVGFYFLAGLTAFYAEEWDVLPMLLPFAIGYTALFYFLSGRIHRVVVRRWPSRPSRAVYAFVILNTLLGFLPIFGISHGGRQYDSTFELYRKEIEKIGGSIRTRQDQRPRGVYGTLNRWHGRQTG